MGHRILAEPVVMSISVSTVVDPLNWVGMSKNLLSVLFRRKRVGLTKFCPCLCSTEYAFDSQIHSVRRLDVACLTKFIVRLQ